MIIEVPGAGNPSHSFYGHLHPRGKGKGHAGRLMIRPCWSTEYNEWAMQRAFPTQVAQRIIGFARGSSALGTRWPRLKSYEAAWV